MYTIKIIIIVIEHNSLAWLNYGEYTPHWEVLGGALKKKIF